MANLSLLTDWGLVTHDFQENVQLNDNLRVIMIKHLKK